MIASRMPLCWPNRWALFTSVPGWCHAPHSSITNFTSCFVSTLPITAHWSVMSLSISLARASSSYHWSGVNFKASPAVPQ